jgi:mannitol operon transcriptional antiterminator
MPCIDLITQKIIRKIAISGANDNVSVKTILRDVDISYDQFYYRLPIIYQWLLENGVHLLKPERGIIKFEDSGLLNHKEEIINELNKVDGYSYKVSKGERDQYIIFTLLLEDLYTPIKKIAHDLSVSYPTINTDMDDIEEWLGRYNLTLIRRPGIGFKIGGEELQKREALIDFLIKLLGGGALISFCYGSRTSINLTLNDRGLKTDPIVEFLESLELNRYMRIIDTIENAIGKKFIDNAYISLILYLAVMIRRVQNDHPLSISNENLNSIQNKKEFYITKLLLTQIEEEFSIHLPEAEVAYLTIHIISAGVMRVFNVRDKAITDQFDRDLVVFAEKIVNEASLYLHPYLRVDNNLLVGILNHLEPVINRIKYGVPIKNPLLSEMKKNYPYLMEVANRSSKFLEETLNQKISDDELGYIAMHLGAAMERLKSSVRELKRICVVCPEGISTSWLLVSKLQSTFKNIEIVNVISTRELMKTNHKGIDAVISTVPIDFFGITNIVVNSLLLEGDIEKILDILDLELNSKPNEVSFENKLESFTLLSLLKKDLIELKVSANNWQEAIDAAGLLLLHDGLIESNYIHAMKEMVKTYGPYMVIRPGIALLHALPEQGVIKPCISLVTLENPVIFGHEKNDPVKLIFALGTTDDKSHLKAQAQLARLIANDELVEKIIRADNKDGVIALIRLAIGSENEGVRNG